MRLQPRLNEIFPGYWLYQLEMVATIESTKMPQPFQIFLCCTAAVVVLPTKSTSPKEQGSLVLLSVT